LFESITYLKNGTTSQKRAYKSIKQLGIMEEFKDLTPILCGTVPLDIDCKGSDLDIIMEVKDFDQFKIRVIKQYGNMQNFKLKVLTIRGELSIKANFIYSGFEYELFGQSKPVKEQYAYQHMIIEHVLLEKFPHIRDVIIMLKKQGYKTEPAFCKVLGIEGDPYEGLVEYGRKQG
jgi:hypothetical protein